MNKTKTIYFLSAIVLIIGCYALNLSYSLFVQTESKDIVNATVPVLEGTISLPTLILEPGEECLVKQTLTNTGTVAMHYALDINGDNNTFIAREITDTAGVISKEALEPKAAKDVYVYVSNTGESSVNLTFELNKTYSTVTNNLSSNIDTENKYTLNFDGELIGPYTSNPERLNAHIINQYMASNNYNSSYLVDDSSNNSIEDLFINDIEKVSLPLNNEGKINREILSFTDVATLEEGLYSAEDDYGISYYYRGASSVNYVSFAGVLWRIVRINGDGSIRIISETLLGNRVQYNTSSQSPYLGYMFGDANSSTYDGAHANIYSSVAKENVDKIYETYLKDDYEAYLSDTLFCGDKSIYSGTGLIKTNTTYNAQNRIIRGDIAIPTLKCAEGVENNYSRYTSKGDMSTTTSKGIELNNDLTYPIALLSADELVMAGSFYGKYNESFYLYQSIQESNLWWTMTPSYSTSGGQGYIIIPNEGIIDTKLTVADASFNALYVRPVINLREDIEVSGGDGSRTTPYTIKLPD